MAHKMKPLSLQHYQLRKKINNIIKSILVNKIIIVTAKIRIKIIVLIINHILSTKLIS